MVHDILTAAMDPSVSTPSPSRDGPSNTMTNEPAAETTTTTTTTTTTPQVVMTPIRQHTSESTPSPPSGRADPIASSSPISPSPARLDPASAGATPPQWSSAVGRATTGKSGRVIERIQAENDRLRRELKMEVLNREEEQKRSESARSQLHMLQSANENLAQMREMEKTSLARKERKVDELRSEVESERTRRVQAESQLKEAMQRHDAVEGRYQARLRVEIEQAKRAVTQYDVLSASWRQMDDDYRRKTEKLRGDVTRLRLESTEDRRKLHKLEVVIEQQKQEVEKMRAAGEGFVATFEAFKRDAEDGTRALRERAQQNEKANDEAMEEALRLLEQLKHFVHLGRCIQPTD